MRQILSAIKHDKAKHTKEQFGRRASWVNDEAVPEGFGRLSSSAARTPPPPAATTLPNQDLFLDEFSLRPASGLKHPASNTLATAAFNPLSASFHGEDGRS